jgi:hypothetical protein
MMKTGNRRPQPRWRSASPRSPAKPSKGHPPAASFLRVLSEQFRRSSARSIPKVDSLSPREFFDAYYYPNRPVIIRGLMKDWKALRLWTPDYIAREFGKYRVEIAADRSRDPHYESNFDSHRQKVLMGEFVRMVKQGGKTNDYYLSARNFLFRRRKFAPMLRHMRCPAGFLKPASFRRSANLFFGPKGTITPLHFDGVNILFGQVYGRKLFKLIPPFDAENIYGERFAFSAVDAGRIDASKFPLMRRASILRSVVEPGDFLFIPIGWYHWVKALDISISVSFTNFSAKGGAVAWRFWE